MNYVNFIYCNSIINSLINSLRRNAENGKTNCPACEISGKFLKILKFFRQKITNYNLPPIAIKIKL